ncbi:MAG: hypothetical protein JWP14_2986 [Frankiales bacterium]|jgi:hypothetical protein|nr:hypothetical protein [Frankiales bacterium]
MSFSLLGVYSHDQAASMGDVAQQAAALGANVLLWALDEPAPDLATWTVGLGRGPRCELINRLYAQAPADGDIVVSDHDVAFARGDLARFLERFREGGWDLAQPAQPWRGSYASYRFSRRRPWLVSRDTTFVEVGPLFVVAARSRDLFLPFPEWGMGWGVELLWWDRVREGARLGMVDDVTIRHLSPLFTSYHRGDEQARLQEQLAFRGLRSIRQIQQTVGTVRRRPW